METDSNSEENNTEFKVYRRRWAILATVCVLNISNAILWINFASVATIVADFFEKDTSAVNLFSVIFMLISIPFCFVSTFVVDRVGLRTAILAGATLNCVGATVRAVSTTELIDNKNAQYGICLFGQVFAAMAQPFLLFIPTKVSQLWFPESSRAIATAILSLSNPLGIFISQVATPAIVTTPDKVPLSNDIWFIPAAVALLLALFSVTRSKPLTPPSQSAERGETERPSYCQQLKSVFTCVPYLILLLTMGAGIALFSVLEFCGLSNGILILAGLVGSTITGLIVDRTKQFTLVAKLCFGMAAIFCIGLLEFYLERDRNILLATFSAIFGFFGVGVYPIGLELGVESTYPVEETISTAFIFMSGQLQGIILIALVTGLAREAGSDYISCNDMEPFDYTVSLIAIMVYTFVVVTFFIVFFRTPYKRTEADKRHHEAEKEDIDTKEENTSITYM